MTALSELAFDPGPDPGLDDLMGQAEDVELRVLALDLALTATGVATPDGALSTIRPPATIGDHRLAHIRTAVAELVEARDPTLVTLEGPVVRTFAATAIGMVHGAVRVALIDANAPYLIVPPATLKTYATGRGNAPKPDLRMALYQRAGIDSRDDNQVDAAWLRFLTLDYLGHPAFPLPKTHRRALDTLTFGTTE